MAKEIYELSDICVFDDSWPHDDGSTFNVHARFKCMELRGEYHVQPDAVRMTVFRIARCTDATGEDVAKAFELMKKGARVWRFGE